MKVGANYTQNILNVAKSIMSSIWFTMLIAIIGFIITIKVDYGEYIGVFVFGILSVVLLICTPKAFGRAYYENVYLVIKEKMISTKVSK